VTVLESEGDYVEVGGQVVPADKLEYQFGSTDKQVTLKILAQRGNLSNPPLQVVVHVPKQLQVKVETDNASVFVRDYQGDLEVASTSGNIRIERMAGEMTLRSNRGNITVRESSGSISVVGNYGALTIQDVNGEIGVSTIMGNVVFTGLVQAGDIVRLETDHGSVSVNLSRDSALGIQVRSTSGDVACMLPRITTTTRTCDGEIRSGGGMLSIRTVSGAVTLQLIP
jgi:DUF4097 and DUF4098 domain-containing protein YvlB